METKGKRWKSEDLKLLENLYKSKLSLDEIASEMGRTKGGIESRMAKLLSIDAESMSLDEISKKYGRNTQEIQVLINSRWNSNKQPEEMTKDSQGKIIRDLENENRFLEAKIRNIQLKAELESLNKTK